MSTFRWRGRTLDLLDAEYNSTLTNERAVEIPIALDFINRTPHMSAGLEVGNVLSHYLPPAPPWRRVDRDEIAPGVENLDVFQIQGGYDWIVSISTIEHIRNPPNHWAGAAALFYLRGLLHAGGRMLVTVGLGQTPLDEWLLYDETGASFSGTMVRDRNGWVQTKRPETRDYGPKNGARAVWIGDWEA